MSVFLRWGVFGILAVAALLYAYNASKRMGERHRMSAPARVVQPAEPETDAPEEDADELSASCREGEESDPESQDGEEDCLPQSGATQR